ncbi:MAG TPA: YbaK/EbsC family protein [Stellaceae bacterium]|nr:YbaK/EbsC family protein [Stellaceae bacterium]
MSEAALPPAAQRVQALLREAVSECMVTMLAATARSAAEAAASIGCTVAQIAKSLVFRSAGGRAVLVIASGTNRVDERKIAAALGENIGKADADFVRDHTGYAIGGVAPIGHPPGVRIFIDADLANYDSIWAAAGHPHAVFRLTPAELVRLTKGTIIAVAAEPV